MSKDFIEGFSPEKIIEFKNKHHLTYKMLEVEFLAFNEKKRCPFKFSQKDFPIDRTKISYWKNKGCAGSTPTRNFQRQMIEFLGGGFKLTYIKTGIIK